MHIVLRGISCVEDQHEEARMNIDVRATIHCAVLNSVCR